MESVHLKRDTLNIICFVQHCELIESVPIQLHMITQLSALLHKLMVLLRIINL